MLKRMLASAIVLAMVAVTHCEAGLVFTESMGIGSNGAISAHAAANGFDRSATLTFGGSGLVGNDLTSLGSYADASGGLNVYLTSGSRDFSITGIDTSSFGSPYTLSFGVRGTGAGAFSDLGLEYFDGTTWNALGYNVDNTLVDQWQLVTTNNLSFPSISNFGLRWTNNAIAFTGTNFRIDDVSLSAVPEPTSLLLVGLTVGAGVLRRRRA